MASPHGGYTDASQASRGLACLLVPARLCSQITSLATEHSLAGTRTLDATRRRARRTVAGGRDPGGTKHSGFLLMQGVSAHGSGLLDRGPVGGAVF